MLLKTSTFRLLLAGLTTGLLACGHDNLVLPDESAAAKIAIVSGDGQSGAAGTALAEELVVAVTDALDRPVVGETVSFAPVGGSGAGGQVSEATVVTGSDGHAATRWTLGQGVGSQQVRAGVVRNGAVVSTMTATFNATATAGPAARLAFAVQPSNTVAGAAISPAVKVEVQDQYGNRVTTATTAIALALGSNPSTATLSGGGSTNAVDGVATFADVSLNRAGTGYTLTANASGGIAPATSASFAVGSGTPHHLDFTLASSARAGSAISPAQVTVRDALNNVVTSSSLAVTVAIQNNPASGTLSGTKTVTAVNGVATFTDLAIDRAGNGYTLQASGGGLTVQSGALNVLASNANGLAFVSAPTGSVTGATLGTFQVRVVDAQGNVVTNATNAITINSSVAGTLSGTNTTVAVNGVATFANVAITKAGDYRLVAHGSGLVDATTDPFTVAKASTTIRITTPAGSSALGQPYTVSYDIEIVAPGTGSLTGSVEVTDGVNRCVGGITSGSWTGSCPDTFFTAGSRTITARYLGDQNFEGSTSAGVSHTVAKATPTITASDTPDPSTVGQPFTASWNITGPSGAPAPTGNVTVTMAHNDAACVAPVSAGSCSITPTSAASDTITVSYEGDANYNATSATRPHVVNAAPTANDDNATVDEDGTLTVSAANGVLQNDTDGQNDPLSAVLTGNVAHGSLTLHDDGSFTYTPAANFNGTDSFTYRASDGQAQSADATVTITVRPVNDAPSFTAGPDVTVNVTTEPQSVPGWATNLSAGPADESGQTLAFQVVDISSDNGSLFAPGGDPAIDANGNLTFTPAGVEGTATVTVRLTDNGGTANGGQDASPTTTFKIAIVPAP